MENSSMIKTIEVASSCCGSLYELYRRKVHPELLEVSAHREFLGGRQHVASELTAVGVKKTFKNLWKG